MRGVLLVLLVSCTGSPRGTDDIGSDFDPPGRGGNGCRNDSQCASGELCARTGSCMSASLIRAVHVNWTVSGSPVSDDACSPSPDFEIDFRSSDDGRFGYAPVPCAQGRFTVDKLPTKYTSVQLRHGGKSETAAIDAAGEALFDLAL